MQLSDFQREDSIQTFADIRRKHCPPGFQVRKTENAITLYKRVFDDRNFPIISQTMNIDKDLHANLQGNCIAVPLYKWFIEGYNAKLVKFFMPKIFQLFSPSKLISLSLIQYPPRLLRYTSPQYYYRLKE